MPLHFPRGKIVGLVALTTAAVTAGYLAYKAVTSQSSRTPNPQESALKSTDSTIKTLQFRKSIKRKAEDTVIAQSPRSVKRCRSDPTFSRHQSSLLALAPLPSLECSREFSDDNLAPDQSSSSIPFEDVFPGISTDAQSTASDSDYSDLEPFQDLMGAIDFEGLKQEALTVRRRVHEEAQNSNKRHYELPSDLECTIADKPRHGSYNIIYFITYSDGVRWVARFPGHGLRFDHLDKTKMNSEYHTMRYIRANTSVALPHVYHWELGSTKIGAPFALMELMPGRPLQEVWYTMLHPHQKLRLLDDIARSMSELSKLSFGISGQLRFSAEGYIRGVGPQIYLEAASEPGWGETCQVGPYLSYASYLDDLWPHHGNRSDGTEGPVESILQMAVESIPSFVDTECPITLAMTDLDSQNVLVDDQGSLTGFIDWDCVATEHMSAGCARYPAWLMRDWVFPNHFEADYSAELEEDEDVIAKATNELSTLREYYAGAFLGYARDRAPHFDPRVGRVSHLLAAIESAIEDSINRTEIVWKLLEHAIGEEPRFSPKDYADAYEVNDTSQYDDVIRKTFADMWHAEWEVRDAGREQSGIEC